MRRLKLVHHPAKGRPEHRPFVLEAETQAGRWFVDRGHFVGYAGLNLPARGGDRWRHLPAGNAARRVSWGERLLWRLPPATTIRQVRLRVADLPRALRFYRDLLGFRERPAAPGTAALSASGAEPAQIVLEERRGARRKPPGTTGLYHVAILLPGRRELARLVRRLAAAGWPFQGFSDHGVSEAVYLPDPDGNGLELYADRPRTAWPWQDGELVMFTRPLDVEGLLAELARDPERPGEPMLHPDARIGHIHLHVADLARSEAFYHGLLGFDVVTRRYPGALFLAAGGYHHHLGLNIWAGRGAPPPPADAAGLVDFTVAVGDPAALNAIVRRLRDAGHEPYQHPAAGWRVSDPDGMNIVLAV